MELLVMLVGFGALMYFFMIRPQQKRMKEHQSLVNSLSPGARVMLNSGMFATVRHMGQQQAIVELAPGVEITITKNSVARIVGDNDEEFEFSEDVELEDDVHVSADDLEPSDFLDSSDASQDFDPRPDADETESDSEADNDGDAGSDDTK